MTHVSISQIKICAKCGEAKLIGAFSKKSEAPDGLRGACKICLSDDSRRWYSKNKDRVRQRQMVYRKDNAQRRLECARKWRMANKAKVAEYSARYKDKHQEKVAEYKRKNADRIKAGVLAWAQAHPESHRTAMARWHKKNPHKGIEYRQKNRATLDASIAIWRAANPEHQTASNQRRRARLRNAEGSHTHYELTALLELQNHKCANPYCAIDLHRKKKHIDHVVPLSNGGSNMIQNLQWLCMPCNQRKSHLMPGEWMRKERILAEQRRTACDFSSATPRSRSSTSSIAFPSLVYGPRPFPSGVRS